MTSPFVAEAIFWVAAACCLAAQAAILRSVLAQGTAPARPARRALEVAWAVAPAVVLALVLSATWRAVHPTQAGSAPLTAEATP